jgi:lipoprotein-releasing system permease protein
VALGGACAIASLGFAAAQPALFEWLRTGRARTWCWTAMGGYAALALLSLALAGLAQRMPQGMPGRLRSGVLGYAFGAFGAAAALGAGIVARATPELPPGAPLGIEDALLMFPRPLQLALIAATALAAVAAPAALGALIGLWFLLSRRVRAVLFGLFDLALLGSTVWLSLRFEFTPRSSLPQDLLGPTARLLATFLLCVRLGARLLPHALNLIEGLDLRSLIAARHLRAKKSGFLAAISFLSILAVSVSSCALTTTLSVMGGFRQDLKRKILGNNAHIVIDRAEGRIADFAPLLARARAVPDVKGVSPYVTGEVMISSSLNLAGAVLRGIDVAKIGEVSDLPKNMKLGSLRYLSEPQELLHLPPSQLGLSLGLPSVSRGDHAEDEPQRAARLTRELAAMLGEDAGVVLEEAETEAPAARAEPPAQAPDAADTGTAPVDARGSAREQNVDSLPGIVVGQELARSLRLYLGDEVNVVTPLGDLGPTGPMPKSRAFRVAGIFYSGMYEYDMKFAYVQLEAAQKFLNAGHTINGIEITVREPERAQETAARLAAALDRPDLRVRGWQELNKNLFGALALEKLAMFIALGIAILVASFCIVGTLTLMVQEKGREVAVLKAMGAGDRTIVSIFVLEGTLIGVFGSLLGLALGYVACFAMEHFGVRLNPEVYYIERLPVHTDMTEFLTVGVAAVLVCLLVTIYPAQLASRLRPVDALRYE